MLCTGRKINCQAKHVTITDFCLLSVKGALVAAATAGNKEILEQLLHQVELSLSNEV